MSKGRIRILIGGQVDPIVGLLVSNTLQAYGAVCVVHSKPDDPDDLSAPARTREERLHDALLGHRIEIATLAPAERGPGQAESAADLAQSLGLPIGPHWADLDSDARQRWIAYVAKLSNRLAAAIDSSAALDAIPLGTPEEERLRAKLWWQTAASHARNEEFWCERSIKAEKTVADLQKYIPKPVELAPKWLCQGCNGPREEQGGAVGRCPTCKTFAPVKHREANIPHLSAEQFEINRLRAEVASLREQLAQPPRPVKQHFTTDWTFEKRPVTPLFDPLHTDSDAEPNKIDPSKPIGDVLAQVTRRRVTCGPLDAGGLHPACIDPQHCICDCRTCKAAWFAAGRPSPVEPSADTPAEATPSPATGKRAPWCCYIAKTTALGCHKPPEWNIYAESDPPDAVTQACVDHVGHLLSDGWHRIWPVDNPMESDAPSGAARMGIYAPTHERGKPQTMPADAPDPAAVVPPKDKPE